jgi:hypothetical protein
MGVDTSTHAAGRLLCWTVVWWYHVLSCLVSGRGVCAVVMVSCRIVLCVPCGRVVPRVCSLLTPHYGVPLSPWLVAPEVKLEGSPSFHRDRQIDTLGCLRMFHRER